MPLLLPDRRVDDDEYRVTAYLSQWPLLTETEARRELGLPVPGNETGEEIEAALKEMS